MSFSVNTYKDRVARALKVASSQGLSGLILTRLSSMIYTAGFVHSSTPERPLFAIYPLDGEPILLAPAIEYGHAQSKAWFKDVRRWYFDLPSREEQPYKTLAKILGDIGLAGKKIGVEEAGAIASLQKEMPGTTLVNTRDLIRDLRMIKSKEELDLMKSRTKYADHAITVVKEELREGAVELEIVATALSETLRKMVKEVKETDGAMPLNVRVVAGPRTAYPHAFSTMNKVKKGDPVLAFSSTSAYGYECGEIARTLFFGKPSAEVKKIYNTAAEAMDLTLSALKPGARCSDVGRVSHDHVTKAGYGDYIMAKPGALRGLESRDGINLAETDQTIIQSTMTFWLGTGICIHGKGGYRLGHLTLVTEKGSEPFHKIPWDIDSMTVER